MKKGGLVMNSPKKSQRPPGYESFFRPLRVALDPRDYERVHFAYVASKYGHAGQIRDGGNRYFDHPKGAAWIYISELGGRDPRVIIALLLHDLSEDTYLLSPYRIRMNFGENTALDVDALTKLSSGEETINEYLFRVIEQGPWSILSKLCDNLHNTRTLDGCTQEKQVRQIKKTKKYHVRLLIPALRRCGKSWASCADVLEKKFADAIEIYEPA